MRKYYKSSANGLLYYCILENGYMISMSNQIDSCEPLRIGYTDFAFDIINCIEIERAEFDSAFIEIQTSLNKIIFPI